MATRDDAGIPFGPRWTQRAPESGPEAQLFNLLRLCGSIALAFDQPAQDERARQQQAESLRVAASLLLRADQMFWAWESDAYFRASAPPPRARTHAVELARTDLLEAHEWVAAATRKLDTSSVRSLLAKARPRSPRRPAPGHCSDPPQSVR